MAIIKCPECGHQTSDKATVCPSCGVEIAGKITKCIHCGEVYFKNDVLCPNCYRAYRFEEPTDQDVTEEDVAETEATDTITDEGLQEENRQPDTVTEQSEDVSDTSLEEETLTVSSEDEKEKEDPSDAQEKDDDTEPDEHTDEDDETRGYIDTDGEDLEKPVHEADEKDGDNGSKHGYIPVVVSLAITALIIAVCFYFYNESKLSRETQAYETAMRSNDVNELKSFLRNFNDASETHRKAINDKITSITKQKEDLSLSLVTKDKAKLAQYLVDYPDTPQKQQILSMIDSIDWEDALKTNTKAAFEKYMAEHQDGRHVKEAKDKVTIKVTAATEEDATMAKSLFREFFLSVNGNDAARLTATLSSQLSQFMGTENASSGDVTGWMKRQHGDDVSNVIWKLNHDYKITKKEQNGTTDYVMEFTAKQTIVKKDGRSSSENYKITSNVTGDKKIASMTMSKYTPQANPAPSPAAPAPKANSTASSAPKASSTASSTPKANSTSSSAPKASAPKASSTASSAPKASSTASSTPKANTTSSSAPKASAPKTSSTASAAPKASAPKASSTASKPTASASGEAKKPAPQAKTNSSTSKPAASTPAKTSNQSTVAKKEKSPSQQPTGKQ